MLTSPLPRNVVPPNVGFGLHCGTSGPSTMSAPNTPRGLPLKSFTSSRVVIRTNDLSLRSDSSLAILPTS